MLKSKKFKLTYFPQIKKNNCVSYVNLKQLKKNYFNIHKILIKTTIFFFSFYTYNANESINENINNLSFVIGRGPFSKNL